MGQGKLTFVHLESDKCAEEICDVFIVSDFILSLSLFCSIPSSFKLYFLAVPQVIYFFLSKGFYLFVCGFLYFIKGMVFILIKDICRPHEVIF